jgi:glycolate oxidase FAD binding subunit
MPAPDRKPPESGLLRARDARDVEQAIAWALAEGKTIELVGNGSKRGIGRPMQVDVTLDLSGLAGVTLYEPEELVLSARAGTPLTEIEQLVASRGQQLAFEPMDCGPLLGGPVGSATIGGTLATNLSGPRRIKAGAARDHLLGAAAVSGRGEAFKAGGRVVKNVTGYDLCKLMCGSWGTLAALTEVTVKTLPRPETEVSVVLRGLDDGEAARAMATATGSSCEVAGAAHLPAATAGRFSMGEIVAAGRALTVLRLEGVVPSVEHRKTTLMTALSRHGEVDWIDDTVSRRLWIAIRDVAAFAAARSDPEAPLWRISTAPMRGHEIVAQIMDQIAGAVEAQALYDWAGGLVWIMLPGAADAAVGVVRAAVKAAGGHATLVRAPAALRAAIDVFEPQEAPIAALTGRIKEGFDPQRVLNPGRMWAGI